MAMDEADLLELAQRIMALPTAPFHEGLVAAEVRAVADDLKSVRVDEDPFGNLHLLYDGLQEASRRAPNLIITAHMDHPGLVFAERVSSRDIIFHKLGGVRDDFARGAKVVIYPSDRDPDRQPVAGRITAYLEHSENTPSHRRGGMVGRGGGVGAFRVRVAQTAAETLGPGSFAMWDLEPFELRGRRLRGRACDDLAGVSVGLGVLRELGRLEAPIRVGLLLTRAEEIGFGGMIAAARERHLIRRSIHINIECSSCKAGAPLGDGPVIRVGDRGWIFDPLISGGLVTVADELRKESADSDRRFRFQRRLMDGGMCEASALSSAGIQTGAVALPLRNYHNQGKKRLQPEVVHLDDALGLVDLLVRAATRPGGLRAACRSAVKNMDRMMNTRYKQSVKKLLE